MLKILTLEEVLADNTPIGPCKSHPKYAGKRKPRVDCRHCWDIYSEKTNTSCVVVEVPKN